MPNKIIMGFVKNNCQYDINNISSFIEILGDNDDVTNFINCVKKICSNDATIAISTENIDNKIFNIVSLTKVEDNYLQNLINIGHVDLFKKGQKVDIWVDHTLDRIIFRSNMQLRKLFNSRPVIKTNYLLLNKYNNCVIKFKDSELDELIDFVENFKEYEESDETVCILGNIRNVDILHDYVLIKKELGYYTILLEEIKNLENLKTVLYDTTSIVQH